MTRIDPHSYFDDAQPRTESWHLRLRVSYDAEITVPKGLTAVTSAGLRTRAAGTLHHGPHEVREAALLGARQDRRRQRIGPRCLCKSRAQLPRAHAESGERRDWVVFSFKKPVHG